MERREFLTGAERNNATGKGRYDLMPYYAIDELAKHCERGVIENGYPENNVRKGIPASSLFDSASRHLSQWFRGYTNEDHLTAAFWNIAWLLEQRTTHPELDDIHQEARDELTKAVKKVKGE